MSLSKELSKKKQNIFLVLAGFFVCNALIAEIIGVKIFSLEALLHLPPAQIDLFLEIPLDFNLTAGVIIWPVVFIITDVINEYFGKSGVKKITYLTAFLITYAFGIIWIITKLPPADFWLAVNKSSPEDPFNINSAFSIIFRQGLGIIIGSLTAFLLGQFLDVIVFQWLRKFTGSKKIWLRATGSTLISQLIDSFVVLIVAFYLWGNWSFQQVISVALISYIYKFCVAICITPILYIIHYFIDRYLGKDHAELLAQEASQTKWF